MICGKTLENKMNNEKICEMTGAARLEEFLRKKRLQWLGHVEKLDEERDLVKALLKVVLVYWLLVVMAPSLRIA